jgi:glycosyltransferase involved in cell wall biosynthesis
MRALVVIPTYNEVATLERVVCGVLSATDAATLDAEILVVDDASPDGTGDLAERLAAEDKRVSVLHRPKKAGLGPAYVAGFAWALDQGSSGAGLGRGYDAICEMDADLSHDPADVPRLLRVLDRADLVIGSRYVRGGGVVDWPPHRRLLSIGGNRYVQLATGLPVTDATAGFRAYRRAVLEEIELNLIHSDGYAFQLELVLLAWRLGFRVVEVPIIFTERREGASKISRSIVAEALWRVLAWGIRGPRHPAPVHPLSVAAPPPKARKPVPMHSA